MPATPELGMDQPYYDWSPIATRTPLRWPKGARVAVCAVVNLEYFEMAPPAGAYSPPGLRPGPFPDVATFSRRDYGSRVGVFRVLEALERHGIPAVVAVDAKTAEHYSELVHLCQRPGWEIIAHGISVNRLITSKMNEAEERDYIRSAIGAVAQCTGARPQGWLGPEYGESSRTPALLAAEGIRYVMDWPNDEQPYSMNVPTGTMVSLPLMLELDDVYAHWQRRVPIQRWGRMVREAFDTLYEDGADNGRLLGLNLHPWLIGQPYRIAELEAVLSHIDTQPLVWKATGTAIVEWYLQQPR